LQCGDVWRETDAAGGCPNDRRDAAGDLVHRGEPAFPCVRTFARPGVPERDQFVAGGERRGTHRVTDQIRAIVEVSKPFAQPRLRCGDHGVGVAVPSTVRTSHSSGKNFLCSVVSK
jgi:hypothetical protein